MVHELLKYDTLSALTQMLAEPDEQLQEQAVWTLGNIAGDGPQPRDQTLKTNALSQTCALILSSSQVNRRTLLDTAVWTLSNLVRGKPAPKFTNEQRAEILRACTHILSSHLPHEQVNLLLFQLPLHD
jgi:hypothetical protein